MRGAIYRVLKEQGAKTLPELVKELNADEAIVLTILSGEMLAKKIVKNGDHYSVANYLLPPVKKLAQGVSWDFGKIKEAQVNLPAEVMNPYNDKVPGKQQGDRGICVGEASSSMMDYFHFALTSEEPTGQIKRDIQVGTAVRDQLYDQTFSAESIYTWSREEGGITGSPGSYCTVAIKALSKKGICLENQWWTSKTSLGNWSVPYPASMDECLAEAAKHKLEGYAAIRTLSELKQCLATRGVAIGGINIYSNYADGGYTLEDGQIVINGDMPDPNDEVMGSHALCFVGYSDSKRRLYFRHSWAGWTRIGSISYDYYNKAGGDFWAPLDTQETIIGKKIYQSVEFDVLPVEARTLAVLTINGTRRIDPLPATFALEKGTTALINISAQGFKSQTLKIPSVDDSVKSILFALEAGTPDVDPFWKRFIDWLIKIFWRK